jgi:hypothetical protein
VGDGVFERGEQRCGLAVDQYGGVRREMAWFAQPAVWVYGWEPVPIRLALGRGMTVMGLTWWPESG